MRRHKPLLYWLSGKKNNTSLLELLQFTFSPRFQYSGKRKRTSIKEDGEYVKVKFNGLSSEIFWPKSFPINSLYQVAAELLYKNWWNYEIKENPITDDDIVLDCGAAEGAFSLQVAERCKKVYAIEPHPQFVSAMEKTFRGINNIQILPIAVGETQGHLKLSDDGIMSKIGTNAGVDIEMNTIDNIFFKANKKVTYIKADLEGFELNMLRGAEMTIKNWKPKLSITTYHYPQDYSNISNYLKSICPEYTIKGIGISDQFGTPIMLHAWTN